MSPQMTAVYARLHNKTVRRYWESAVETARLIDDAQRTGLARIAERNRRILGKLDAIIGALETTQPGQIVAGGAVENLGEGLNAAG